MKQSLSSQLSTHSPSHLKIAIVCDWLTGYGGAERVLLELHKMFPGAPIYTSQYDPKAINWFSGADVRTTWLQKLPKGLRKFLPVFRAWAFSRLDLSEYDLVISSSGAEAKFVKKLKPGSKHISYCHSPTHYYWVRYQEYIKNPGFGPLNWLARIGLKLLIWPMKKWDSKAAQRPDFLIANSNFTKANIKKYYGRESVVIHPPVDVTRFSPKPSALSPTKSGFVTAGRQTPYMRKDLVVLACSKTGKELKVIGNGPEHDKLVKIAGSTVSFLTDVSDEQIPKHFQEAQAFILPGKEDFGIVAVEAMAAGTPVVAFKDGGALDYVVPGVTGEFFRDQSIPSLIDGLDSLLLDKFDSTVITEHAKKFSPQVFKTKIQEFINKAVS